MEASTTTSQKLRYRGTIVHDFKLAAHVLFQLAVHVLLEAG
jgi:hypothetical protein